MTEILVGSDKVRTIIFPRMIRIVKNELFYATETLRSVILNEGLEVLGVDEYQADGDLCKGVFEASGLERVRFPSTLRRIEYGVFKMCARLKSVQFPEGLEYIGKVAFGASGLESVTLPRSVKTVCVQAFCDCGGLREARLNEGLLALGEPETVKGELYAGEVFCKCGL